jgi:hypothetical protein
MLVSMRLVVVCVALGGCQLVFPFSADPAISHDGAVEGGIEITVPTCPGAPFPSGNVTVLAGLESELFDGAMFGDELWMTREEDGDRKIQLAIRDTTGVYAAPVKPPFVDLDADEYEVGISGDGRRLVFISNRDDLEPRVFEATRPEPTEPFGAAIEVAGLPSGIQGLDLSFDGLALYISDSKMQVRVARRSSLETTFGNASALADAQNDPVLGESPSISPDELELFYLFGSEIFRRVRAGRDARFGPPELISAGFDPDLANDGGALVHSNVATGQLQTLRRECV